MWVSFFAILSYNFGIIKSVIYEESLRVLVGVDLDFSQSIMQSCNCDTLLSSLFKPKFDDS